MVPLLQNTLEAAQTLLFQKFGQLERKPRPVFILGSPRTGSTLLYQLVAQKFEVSYFSNFTADLHPEQPVVAAAIEHVLGTSPPDATTSRYGKTDGPHGPSEASSVFTHWFGGGHPSQLVSATIREGLADHFRESLLAIEELRQQPLVTKNAWNCFRIADLIRLVPEIYFVWIRRDLMSAARSDLSARYKHGGRDSWNSASPSNYEEILLQPYWEQVIEQQFEYNRTIQNDLKTLVPSRHHELWYEDLCIDPNKSLNRLGDDLRKAGLDLRDRPFVAPVLRASQPKDPDDDDRRMELYLQHHAARLAPFLRKNQT